MKYKNNQNFIGTIANWILVILFATSLAYAWYETPLHPDKAFYLLPSRFWELASGALLFKLHSHNRFIANTNFKLHVYLIFGVVLFIVNCFRTIFFKELNLYTRIQVKIALKSIDQELILKRKMSLF